MRIALLLTLALACSSPPSSMTKAAFAHYIALGDSISIDVYPAADAARRYPGRFSTDKLGAASLLVKNDDQLWPEFRGRELKIPATDLTADGATTESLLRQVERIATSDDPTLITITAGGNDLLGHIGSRGPNPAPEIAERLRAAIHRVLEKRPNATILVSTVYDPSDGTNVLDGRGRLDREAEWLKDYNERVRRLVETDRRLKLADIHRHFLGHGLTAPENERWYLRESIIEPSARGASEVRRLWLDAIGY
jgi:acyl-CoA thioesterase I